MLELASCPKSIEEVQCFVQELASQYQFREETYANILLSLTEAVNNAIRHGNCNDTSKKVKIKLKENGEYLLLRVSDEGQGFDPKSIPDPTCPENLHKPGGRGVYLIQQVCDRVAFYNNGSTVEMCFTL